MDALAGYGINLVDICIFGVFLIFAIIGFIRGFFNQVSRLLSVIVSLAAAFFLCTFVTTAIVNNTPAKQLLAEYFKGLFSDAWNINVAVSELSAKMTELKVPSFIADIIIRSVTGVAEGTVNILDTVANTLARLVIIAVGFIAIFLIARLICFIIVKIISKVIKKSPLRIIDRILGLVISVVEASVTVNFLLVIANILPIPQLATIQQYIAESPIATFFLEYNIISWLFSRIGLKIF